jgi:hypothetical protein
MSGSQAGSVIYGLCTVIRLQRIAQRPAIIIARDRNHRNFGTRLSATIRWSETELNATETTLFATGTTIIRLRPHYLQL